MSEIGLHEAIFTLRAMRRLAPDPVPEADLRYLIEAATMAPTAQNQQHWAFVVVTDPAQRRAIGDIYRDLGRRFVRDGALASGRLDAATERVNRHALTLIEGMGEVPVQIVVATRGEHPADPVQGSAFYGSVYPAIQNLMLAARSRGLGTTLTTLHKAREADVKRVLGIPDTYTTVALVPVGRPRGRWGRPLRRPAAEVTHWNRWNGAPPGDQGST